MSLMGWGSDSRPMRNGGWLGSLGIMDSVLVLAHHQSESERSYLEKWPYGSQIWFESAHLRFTGTRTWARNYECTVHEAFP